MRRNLQRQPKLPAGWELIAIAYGTGKDDYLATVLCYNADEQKWTTWTANFDTGCEGVAHGHYHSEQWEKDAAEQAWADFVDRSKIMALKASLWAKHGMFPVAPK